VCMARSNKNKVDNKMSGLLKVCCRFPKEHRLYEAMGANCPCFPKGRPLLMLGQPQVISISKSKKKTKKRG